MNLTGNDELKEKNLFQSLSAVRAKVIELQDENQALYLL